MAAAVNRREGRVPAEPAGAPASQAGPRSTSSPNRTPGNLGEPPTSGTRPHGRPYQKRRPRASGGSVGQQDLQLDTPVDVGSVGAPPRLDDDADRRRSILGNPEVGDPLERLGGRHGSIAGQLPAITVQLRARQL